MNYKKLILLPVILGITSLVPHSQDSTCTEKTLLQELAFTKKQSKITSKHKATLDSIVLIVKKCPKLSLVITAPSSACHHNAFIWDRVNSIALYVIEKGIRSENVAFNYNEKNSCEAIYFKLVLTEQLQVAPPHPNLRKSETDKSKNFTPHDRL